MNILIAGDFFISDNYQGHELIDKSVQELFEKADYRIVNLEAPITKDISKNKILKTRPHLRTSDNTTIPFLKQLRIDMVTLANNHILDYGENGLKDTFKALTKEQIAFVGAGNNIQEAAKPFTLEKEGLKIAILNFAENEWSIAENDKPGANPLDIIDNVNQIKAAKATHDKVICIIHGGHEYYHLPSPRMQKQYRFYAEQGADAVIGHHTHCISGNEVYKNVPIIYSLGNFLFTKPSKKDVWYEGSITNLLIEKEEPIKFEIYPVKQQKNSFQTVLLKNHEKNIVFEKIQNFNNTITENEILQKKWDELIDEKQKNYIKYLSPVNSIRNRLVRTGINKLGLDSRLISNRHLLLLLNIIRCESHYNLLSSALIKQHKK